MNNSTKLPMPDQLYDEEMERIVLASMLIDPKLVLLCEGNILQPDDFYLERHRWLWAALVSLTKEGVPIDYTTLRHYMGGKGHYQAMGGDLYLSDLFALPSGIHGETYARLVAADGARRRLLEYGHAVHTLAVSKELSATEALEEASRRLVKVAASYQLDTTRRDAMQLSRDWLAMIEARSVAPERKGGFSGLMSGWRNLDQLTGGLERGQFVIVGGRPGMGKSAFMLKWQLNSARLGIKPHSLYYSLEMSAEELHTRRVSMLSGLTSGALKQPLDDNQFARVYDALAILSGLPIDTDDKPNITVDKIRTDLERLQRSNPVDMVYIDYLQLMSAPGYGNNRVQEIAYISRKLKEISREYNVAIVAGAQLNRSVEQRADKRPQLSDLKDSGSLEQDADIVVFLYRDVVYNEATENPNQADVIVAKHRNGRTDTIPLYFDPTTMDFVEGTRQTITLEGF